MTTTVKASFQIDLAAYKPLALDPTKYAVFHVYSVGCRIVTLGLFKAYPILSGSTTVTITTFRAIGTSALSH